jgi:DNA-binding MarR family transcriptional regulator
LKQLHKETDELAPMTGCAALLMDVAPLVMHRIRKEMRSQRMPNLSVPQFRVLIYLYRNEGASLSELADYIGLKLPSMSKTIDVLVTRGLVIRRVLPDDRRYVSLRLGARGLAELKRARRITEANLAEALAVLSSEQQTKIVEALRALRPIFAPEKAATAEEGR